MADSESFLFKMGFAADAFDSGIRRLEGSVESASEHIAEHMRRPRAQAAAFHQVLHEISNISPIVGEGLRFAFSPVLGIIFGAGLALKGIYDRLKDIEKESKEAAKEYAEMAKSFAKPIDSEKTLREARAAAEKSTGQDRRQMAKEQNELNDPIEKSVQLLKREEEQFNLNKDAAGKLAAQKKLLAEIDAKRSEAQKPVQEYQSDEGIEARHKIELQKEIAERRIKDFEKEIEESEKVKERNKAAYDEQAKIDQDYKEKTGAFPNLRKALSFGDTLREESVNRYKVAEERQQALRRAIDQTQESISRFHETLEEGKAKHAEEFDGLRKLERVHNELSAAVASTEKEIQHQSEEEEKRKKETERKQLELDQRVKRLAKEERRSEIEPYLPTVKELAKLPSWGGDNFDLSDLRFKLQSGPTPAAERAGELARELEAREGLQKRLILNEGAEGSDVLTNQKRINSLKDALEKSGFIKTDHSEKIKERMTELVELAKHDGLVVKPINGE